MPEISDWLVKLDESGRSQGRNYVQFAEAFKANGFIYVTELVGEHVNPQLLREVCGDGMVIGTAIFLLKLAREEVDHIKKRRRYQK